MEWIKSLLDINKIPTRIVILIWLISGLLLFIPAELLDQLSLTEFKNSYGIYIGITFISSFAFIIILSISWIINKVNKQRLRLKYKKLIEESVRTLDPNEISVLREFYIQGQNTLKLPLDNPVVSGLINKRVIYQVGQYGQMSLVGMLSNFSISKVARELITPEILGLPIGEPTQAEIDRIRNERPKWILKIESDRRSLEELF